MNIRDLPSFEEQAARVYTDVCPGPDGDAWIDDASVDQWWRITVACDHGKWTAVSNGPIDLGRGLQRAIAKAQEAHAE